jgi:hypothetical protein
VRGPAREGAGAADAVVYATVFKLAAVLMRYGSEAPLRALVPWIGPCPLLVIATGTGSEANATAKRARRRPAHRPLEPAEAAHAAVLRTYPRGYERHVLPPGARLLSAR